MAKKTYIPGLRIATEGLKRFISRYHAKIESVVGSGIMTVVDFLIDIAEILLAILEQDSDPFGNFDPPESDTLSPSVINSVTGAYQKFLAANGLGGGA